MQQLYQNFIAQIKADSGRFTDLGLEPISTIDLYDGQPEAPDAFEFTLPAIFVDYEIDWERGAARQKRGVLSWTVYIMTGPGAGTESWNKQINQGLRRLYYYDLVGELTEKVSADGIGALCLVSERPMLTEYGALHVLTFNAPIVRDKSRKLTPLPGIEPVITISHE